ncbi:MAG: 16S rRNA (cytidine(1402)-2'-O)-methyltransferase [Bacteroidales bacterium]
MSKLFIVPTPVGNLEDMTYRAVRILSEADYLLTEDTRVTGRLLQRYNISIKMISHHQHNEHKSLPALLDKLKAGMTLALASDAGMPGISDPGFLLIRECIREGIEVECLPGPTAFVPALVASGIPCERFCFEGFLPVKKGRKSRLESLAKETRTMVFYESPHRLLKTLSAFSGSFGGDRQACVSREISKIHEEHVRGSLDELVEIFSGRSAIKGEITLVVSGLTS